MKVGDLVKYWPLGPRAQPRYCLVTSADDRYVTLTSFPQNQVFQRPVVDTDGVRRPSPLELISDN